MRVLLLTLGSLIGLAAIGMAQNASSAANLPKPGEWLPYKHNGTPLVVLSADKPVQTSNGVEWPFIMVLAMKHGDEELFDAVLHLRHTFLNPAFPNQSVFAMRWDKGPATVQAWQLTEPKGKEGIRPPSSPEFMKRLARHSRLTIEGASDGGVPIAIEFTLGNFKEVAASLKEEAAAALPNPMNPGLPAAPAPAKPKGEVPGKWMVVNLDRSTALILRADKAVKTLDGDKSPFIMISFSQGGEDLSVSLFLHHKFLSPDTPNCSVFAMRWDKGPATIDAWRFNNLGNIVAPSSAEFLAYLEQHSRLTIEGKDDGGTPVTIEFTLGNFK